MVVRFLPQASGSPVGDAPERGDLAEVIDLRSRLVRVRGDAVTGAESESAEAAEAAADSIGELEGVRAATEDGVRLLARKARSSGELRRELSQLGHEAEEIDVVLQEFEESLYLDDLGLARIAAEDLRQRKGASRAQVRQKLRERLFPDAVIEEVVAELDDEGEHELLRAAADDRARRLAGLDRQVAERRLLGFLARRGWTGERAARVTREALDAAAARGSVRFR